MTTRVPFAESVSAIVPTFLDGQTGRVLEVWPDGIHVQVGEDRIVWRLTTKQKNEILEFWSAFR